MVLERDDKKLRKEMKLLVIVNNRMNKEDSDKVLVIDLFMFLVSEESKVNV